jgi:hypothetical protein
MHEEGGGGHTIENSSLKTRKKERNHLGKLE